MELKALPNSVLDIDALADQITNSMFELGYEPNSPAKRIQFMGGPCSCNTEKPQGGLSRGPLKKFIQDAIRNHLD